MDSIEEDHLLKVNNTQAAESLVKLVSEAAFLVIKNHAFRLEAAHVLPSQDEWARSEITYFDKLDKRTQSQAGHWDDLRAKGVVHLFADEEYREGIHTTAMRSEDLDDFFERVLSIKNASTEYYFLLGRLNHTRPDLKNDSPEFFRHFCKFIEQEKPSLYRHSYEPGSSLILSQPKMAHFAEVPNDRKPLFYDDLWRNTLLFKGS